MQKKILIATIPLIVFLLMAATGSYAAGHKKITSNEFLNMRADGAAFTIVDVREVELYEAGHIPGAINIPYYGSHERVVKELSPKDNILFVCHGGPMGDDLSALLLENGFKKVYNLRGGMRRYKGPLEK